MVSERHAEQRFKRRIKALHKALKRGRLAKIKAQYLAVIGMANRPKMNRHAEVMVQAARDTMARIEKYATRHHVAPVRYVHKISNRMMGNNARRPAGPFRALAT